VTEWLVVFGWTNKVLYLTTIIVSLVAGALSVAADHCAAMSVVSAITSRPVLIGGVWLTIAAVNFAIEEWRFGWKALLIAAGVAALALLWLQLAGWMASVFGCVSGVEVSLNGQAYLVIAALGFAAIVASWVRGLFHFVAITPSTVLVRRGFSKPTAQFPTADCAIEIDRGDLPKRLLGFGRVIITFKDPSQKTIKLLCGRIGNKAARLKAVLRTMDRETVVPARAAGDEPTKPAVS
jgi:hypothetical protein